MDKFMESPWFVRVIALVFTLLLYVSVNFDELDLKGKTQTDPQEYTETINGLPVQVFYDSENLFVSGVPETVNVEVQGPQSIVQSTKNLRDIKLYIDLTDEGIGEHSVPIKYENISEKLKVRVEPAVVDVVIQEKLTREFSVEPEFNESMLAEGYQVESVSRDPRRVKITGAKDTIDAIAFVKATLDVEKPVDKETTGTAKVRVFDREMNKLDVIVEPETVQVSISVKNPSKKMPIEIKQTGTLPEELAIEELSVEPEEVTVYGKENILESMDSLEAELNVSEISKSGTIELPIKLGEGLNFVSPQSVKVKIVVENKSEEASTKETKTE
ncbi:MAG TPA: CdaR family protein [Chondromyces sp.]|nr:CdaR family protein [Chondromyces sp.]